jgi:short-subunit dehydrogenase
MIRVNCPAVTASPTFSRHAAPRRGAIVIVASVAGYQPLGLSAT